MKGELPPTLPSRSRLSATLIDEPEVVADDYQRRSCKNWAFWPSVTSGVRVSLEQAPTRDEWLDFVRREGMSIVEVDLGDGPPS